MKSVITPAETHLQAQEDFVKNQIAAEKERVRQNRIAELEQYDVVIGALGDLGEMDDETYTTLVESSIRAFEAKQDEERKKEEERLAREKAEAEERERIRKENEKLKIRS